ncbi:MAG: DUF4249 family protein, partial [Balneolales bacterium]
MHCKVYFFIILIACLTMTACEQVIDVDLNEASPRYVIEGTVTDSDGPHQVKVTQSKNFDEVDDFEGVDYAEVIISDDRDNSELLTYTDSGIYQGNDVDGTPGRTYSLTVTVEGETFTASSKMPEPVKFETLYIETITIFGLTINIPKIQYYDPEGIENYYRHVLFVNGEQNNSIFVSSDALYDGSQMERDLPLNYQEDGLTQGDTLLVKMQSIDEQSYEYFSSLIKTINRSAASPANPITNISGGALGYF